MFEDQKALLSLCYDSIEEVKAGAYIVSLNGEYGIVDHENNSILPINFRSIIAIGKKLYVKGQNNKYYLEIDYGKLSKHSVSKETPSDKSKSQVQHIADIKRISEHGYVFTLATGEKGLFNSLGEQILPYLYTDISIRRELSNKDMLYVALTYDMYTILCNTTAKSRWDIKLSYIEVDKHYRRADCLVAYETTDSNIQIVMTDILNRKYPEEHAKYKLRVNGKIVGKGYDSIMVRERLIRYGICEVYSGRVGDMSVGIVSFTGDELVPPEKYSTVDYIGNSVYVVSRNNTFGTVVNNTEVIETSDLKLPKRSLIDLDKYDETASNDYYTSFSIMANLPLAVLFKGNEQYFIGNDGKAYKNISDAFPLYQSLIDSNIFIINMYGKSIFIDKNLNILSNVPEEVRDVYKWKKL